MGSFNPAAYDWPTIYTNGAAGRAFQIKNGAGAAIDITGWSFRMHLREPIGSNVVALELSTDNLGLMITDPTNGRFQAYISPEQAARLTPGSYRYDIRREAPAPKQVLIVGTIPVEIGVTRP